MNKNLDLKNCFEFICPEKWDNLEKSDNKSVRFSKNWNHNWIEL